ncbi:hypothetical protein Q0590_14215 [Rhodocytophaga aerolata]|uniref:Uncharacterized protein n=1 Tax=Rhodocytophaga aerolata TaxID=455078 RepID=A0ABT8R5P6_9BACT|nr:hypothetical protein [Rhodocytophaga aerolata]MDO1447419.1 hypothetical protein [Rhodocytophaga aerolata]
MLFKHGASSRDWIKEHDRLQQLDFQNPFDQRNLEDWWLQNYKIRKLFDSIEAEIKASIKKGVTPSIRIVSWVRLAKKLKCDRATLKHSKRYFWTKNRKENIEKIILENKNSTTLNPNESRSDKLKEIKETLSKQRNQTAHWFTKCKALECAFNELSIYTENLKAKVEEYEKIIAQLPNLEQNLSILEKKVFSIHRNNNNNEPTS